MASALFGQRFRRAVGDADGTLFENEEIDDYGLQADEDYPNASFNAKVAYAVMLGYSDLRAQYAPRVSYTANAASESLGQAFEHYDTLVKQWQARFEELLTQTDVAVQWGSTEVHPTRDKEFPDA